MLSGVTFALVAVIILALLFDFINGFHDTANCIATSVSTRVLTPRQAIIMAAILNFVGAMMSEKVAKTISKGLVNGSLEQYVIIAALLSAIIWNLVTWYFGIPSSSSHALIGALVGASITFAMSFQKVAWNGVLQKVIVPLITSPIIGFLVGYLFMTLLYELLRPFSHWMVNRRFAKLQIVSAALMAYSHGNNDAQKSMGIITLALISSGLLPQDAGVPILVKLGCAIAMGIGTSIGGWKIIKTMGTSIIKLQPIDGFAVQTASAAVIEVATAFGAPVSTTHVISATLMGVGASKRFSAVKWGTAFNIIWAWVITIPISAALGALITFIIKIFI